MADLRQTENLFIELSGEGAADLICIGARVRERFSTIPEMRMEFTVKTTSFDPKSILGKRITLKTQQEFQWTGLVVSVEDVGLEKGVDVYAAELRSWLWLATLGEENRIYQKMDALEIIADVFDKMGISDFQSKVTGKPEQREYCVQYGESNFAFISRLMEEEGIYYAFDHTGATEKMILANDASAHEDKGEIQFTKSNIQRKVRADADTIYEWAEVGKVVSGKVSLWDYDFTQPRTPLLVSSAGTGIGAHAHNKIERYQSGGHYKTADKGEGFAKHITEANSAHYARATGLCNTVLVRTGVKFNLKHPERPAADGSYLVIGSTHYIRFDDQASGTETDRLNRAVEQIAYPKDMALYDAEFEVMPSAVPFKPQKETPWPEVPSLLTAVVTGPGGDEIHTDLYGRIKVQFPWDRLGKKDDTSTCFVRSVMPWTGNKWGFLAVPRIGMEVIIQFERGNIDRPICTGMVYNGDNKPPYDLPGEMNKMGWRTNSTKGGGGFHELTMDDTKGSESVFFQSERDYKQVIKNDAEITIGMEKKDPGDLTQTIFHNFTEIIKTGDVSQKIESGSRITYVNTDDTTTILGKSAATITGDTSVEITDGNLAEKVGKGNMATEVSQGNQRVTVNQGNINMEATAGTITIEAGQSITLKVGTNSITIDTTGVKIEGAIFSATGKASAELVSNGMVKVDGGPMVTISGMTMVKIN